MKTLVVVGGPTGIGKTAMAIRLAQHFATEIVSADSRQIFKETYIGTAVPSPSELAAAKHHFIATKHVTDNYNAWQYEQDALATINEIFKTHNIAILVGGSGMYIDAVCHGIDEIPDIAPELRSNINHLYETEGIESLQRRLKLLDPDYYEIVDLKNPMRLKRAVEICIQSGQPYSKLRTEQRQKRPFQCVKIALNLPREEMYNRINRRVDAMIEAGLEQEVRSLQHLRDFTALKTVGYREFFDYFDGTISYTEAVEKIKQNTRKYAKKQITWINRTNDYTWFSPSDFEEIVKKINSNL